MKKYSEIEDKAFSIEVERDEPIGNVIQMETRYMSRLYTEDPVH